MNQLPQIIAAERANKQLEQQQKQDDILAPPVKKPLPPFAAQLHALKKPEQDNRDNEMPPSKEVGKPAKDAERAVQGWLKGA